MNEALAEQIGSGCTQPELPKGPDVSPDGGQYVVFQGEMKPAMHGLSTVHAPNLQTGAHRPRPAGGPQWEAQASAEMKRTPGDSG